jgi:hypothetical protein
MKAWISRWWQHVRAGCRDPWAICLLLLLCLLAVSLAVVFVDIGQGG